MAFEVLTTAWDTQAIAAQALQQFNNVGIIDDSSFLRFQSGTTNFVVPNVANVTASYTSPGATLSGVGSTETSVILTPDSKISASIDIPYEVLWTHNGVSPDTFAQTIGTNLRKKFEMSLQLLIAKNAPTQVTFDKDATASTSPTQTAVAEKLLQDISYNFDANEIDPNDRFVYLHPLPFTWCASVPGIRSGDYIGTDAVNRNGNQRPFQEFMYLGMRVRSYVGKFLTNAASDTTFDSKYRQNMASMGSPAGGCYGIAYHRSALAVNYFQPIEVMVDKLPGTGSWLLSGFMQAATGLPRGSTAGSSMVIIGN